MNLRKSFDTSECGQAYINCVYAAGEAKLRMLMAEFSEAERAEARQIASSQRCPLLEAAAIVGRSRR